MGKSEEISPILYAVYQSFAKDFGMYFCTQIQ